MCPFTIFDILDLAWPVIVGLAVCEFIRCILDASSYAESNIIMCIICATIILVGVIVYVGQNLARTHSTSQNILRQVENDIILKKVAEAVGVLDDVEDAEVGEDEEGSERKVEWKDGELKITFEIREVAAPTEAEEEIRETLSRDIPTPTSEIEPTAEFKDLLVREESEESEPLLEPVPTMPAQVKTAKARRGRKKTVAQSTK
jgi:hypothetical protein